MRLTEEEEKRPEAEFKEIIAKSFPKLIKDTDKKKQLKRP